MGAVFKGNWEIMPEIRIDYILRFDRGTDEPLIRIEDVWVHLNQVIFFLIF